MEDVNRTLDIPSMSLFLDGYMLSLAEREAARNSEERSGDKFTPWLKLQRVKLARPTIE
jgi:hypothetical protein